MPHFKKFQNVATFLTALILMGFIHACSSTENISVKAETSVVEPKNTFDPIWFDNINPTKIDSNSISASVFVQATTSEAANEVASIEAKKALSLATDNYVERLRKNNEEQQWSAAQLIALRRFVDTYVLTNATISNEFQRAADLGFYTWMQARIDKLAFDEVLSQKFSL